MAVKWQLGEAPRDGQWYLLYHEDFIVPVFGRFDGHAWRDDLGRLVRRQATHWMWKPEDPSAE